jgi:hypothetical protein
LARVEAAVDVVGNTTDDVEADLAHPGCAFVGVVAPIGVVAEVEMGLAVVGIEIAVGVDVDGDTEDTGTSFGADVTRRWLAFPCACHCTCFYDFGTGAGEYRPSQHVLCKARQHL